MSSELDMESIPFYEIPLSLMEGLPDYSVTLICIWRDRPPTHCGSGTLVRSGGRHYILTAAHCAEPLTRNLEIGLTLGSYEHRFTIPATEPIFIGEPKSEDWVPI